MTNKNSGIGGWIIFTLVVLGALGGVAWWQWEFVVAHHDILRTLLLAAAVVIATAFAVWRGLAAERQADIAGKQTLIANEQARATERGLRGERFQMGADMLGSDTLTTRVGSVYALEALARNHPREYHLQAMELLSMFIRFPKAQEGGVAESSRTGRGTKCPSDIEVAAQAIGRRTPRQLEVEKRDQSWFLELREVNLSGAMLYQANLSGKVDLMLAVFSNAILEEADLSGAVLDDADLSGACLDGAKLSGTGLVGADLSGASMRKVKGLTQADLDEAIIWEGERQPDLDGAVCAKTREPLVWQGEMRTRLGD